MSDTTMTTNTGPYRPPRRRRGKIGGFGIDDLPTPEELASVRHKGEDADRFTLYTPEQIDQETRDARIQLTFGDVIKIRDQAEMVIACMQHVIAATRKHDIGSIRQRIEARREVASLVERITLFNGKTPYGYAKKKR